MKLLEAILPLLQQKIAALNLQRSLESQLRIRTAKAVKSEGSTNGLCEDHQALDYIEITTVRQVEKRDLLDCHIWLHISRPESLRPAELIKSDLYDVQVSSTVCWSDPHMLEKLIAMLQEIKSYPVSSFPEFPHE